MNVYLTGAAVVKDDMFATPRLGVQEVPSTQLFRSAPLDRIFEMKSTRFGRFGKYTRFGCAAAGLALHDAGLETRPPLSDTGFILAGQYGSFTTDMAYYETTGGSGRLSSPNLFSYTLPNIVIGECALRFGLMGPTFCLDSEGSWAGAALVEAAVYLAEGLTAAMLVGWIEILPDRAPPGDEGAVVLVFGREKSKDNHHLELEADSRSGMCFPGGKTAAGIDELLQALGLPGSSGHK